MRYLELLIDEARALSGNSRYDADSGVSQRTFRQFFQNAQDFIVREIVLAKTKYFLASSTVTVVPGQESYSYPTDIFMQGIDTIQWSDDGINWGPPLVKNIPKDKGSTQRGGAYGYILSRAGYLLTPPVSSGYLLVNYNKKPKRLEKRSGKVSSTTGTPITSIAIDTSYAGHDPTYLNQFGTISIVGKNGVPKVSSIPITGVSSGTITVSNYTLGSGESISAGDFVLAEGSTTNLPDYDDTIESFLIMHATYQAKYGDASKWSQETKDDVMAHAVQIINAFKSLSEDIGQIPITCADYLYID